MWISGVLHLFFYKQLALLWQIAKQLSGLKPLLLSSNENNRLEKSGIFLCNRSKMAVKATVHQNSAISKALLGKFLNTDHKCQFWILKIIVFVTDSLLGQTTKQTLSNIEPQNPWKYKQLWGLRPDSRCL